MNESRKVVVVTGPTASGKTACAVRLAKSIGGEILSADSRQVFRHMNIGTGKDLEEYGTVPYHLIDIRDPDEEFSVSDFRTCALLALRCILRKGKYPIVCGGTVYYIKALIDNYRFDHPPTNPRYSGRLEKRDREELYAALKERELWNGHHWERDSKRRMARAIEKAQTAKRGKPDVEEEYGYPTRIYYPLFERKQLKERIGRRLRERLRGGMVEEVSALLNMGIRRSRLERFGLEYRWILRHLKGELSFGEMERKLYVEICRFSKRQSTFLRYLERSGHRLTPFGSFDELLTDVKRWIAEPGSSGGSRPTAPKN